MHIHSSHYTNHDLEEILAKALTTDINDTTTDVPFISSITSNTVCTHLVQRMISQGLTVISIRMQCWDRPHLRIRIGCLNRTILTKNGQLEFEVWCASKTCLPIEMRTYQSHLV